MNRAFHLCQIAALLIFALSSNFWPGTANGKEQLPVCQMIATGGTITSGCSGPTISWASASVGR